MRLAAASLIAVSTIALSGALGGQSAQAGQVGVISPPAIVVPVPPSPVITPPATPSNPSVPAAPPTIAGGGQTSASGVTASLGSTAGSLGGAPVPAPVQSFSVGALSPGQMQAAAIMIRGLLAEPGALSSDQRAVLQAQLVQMEGLMGQ